jgi:hypothetical protein
MPLALSDNQLRLVMVAASFPSELIQAMLAAAAMPVRR